MKKWLYSCIVVLCVFNTKSSDVPDFLDQRVVSDMTTGVPELIPEPQADTRIKKAGISQTNEYPSSQAGVEKGVRPVGLPRNLNVTLAPSRTDMHQLEFNVSWSQPRGVQPDHYSLEIYNNDTTQNCTTLCYESIIPPEIHWVKIPHAASSISGCSLRPGCNYSVQLNASYGDRMSSASHIVRLKECEEGVCSCTYEHRLPKPVVKATMMTNGRSVNVSWYLPRPEESARLPQPLAKKLYLIRISRQVALEVINSFDKSISDTLLVASGPVADGDKEKSIMASLEEIKNVQNMKKYYYYAKVSLIDEKDCIGPEGYTKFYDPLLVKEASNTQAGTFAIWASVSAACAIIACVLLTVSARGIHYILRMMQPSPSVPSDPLRPLTTLLSPRRHTDTNNYAIERDSAESPIYKDNWEVSWSEVEIGPQIGRGAFGKVHLAKLNMSGTKVTVAAKLLNDDAGQDELTDFLGEIAMMKHAGEHSNVIKLVGCCTRLPHLIAFLEHAPRGDLLSLLQRARRWSSERESVTTCSDDCSEKPVKPVRPSEADTEYTNLSDVYDQHSSLEDKPLAENNRDAEVHYVAEPIMPITCATMRDYALQVALGMRHLEKLNITHRDLAARNVLMDGAGVLKVADFGLSRLGIYVHVRPKPVPLRWIAPEAITHACYSSASDAWAYGILLWEIATLGDTPYPELRNNEVFPFLASGCRLSKPPRASPRLYKVMLNCWMEDSSERPTFAYLVSILQAQQQLYVDLDSAFTSEDTCTLDLNDKDFDFKMSSSEGTAQCR